MYQESQTFWKYLMVEKKPTSALKSVYPFLTIDAFVMVVHICITTLHWKVRLLFQGIWDGERYVLC